MSTFRPLEGIRVLDWSEGVAGPYSCQLMGDLGAQVIKVERPQGDWGRGSGGGDPGGGYHFRALNRGKRNLCLDLRQEGAREVALRLMERADVMVTAYRPGVMERLGLGYDDVAARAPSLIYVRISAYGYRGALAERPGSDTILQAVSGLMSQIGDPAQPPQRVGVPIIDFLAARDAVIGVLGALVARGGGRELPGPVDVSLFASAATFQAQLWQKYFEAGTVQPRAGHRNPSLAPAGLYRTKDDRYVAVAVLRDEHFVKLCEAVGREDLTDDPRFRSNADRLAHREELESLLEPVFASRGYDEWVARLLDHDVLAGPVTELPDIEGDDGLSAALPVVLLEERSSARVRAIGPPISFEEGDAAPRVVSAPALPGQHSREILSELGYVEGEIDGLIAAGVTQQAETEGA